MSVKTYGIYLAYPPTIELQNHGLGRYLIEFLKGAQDHDVNFVIACPSWMRSNLARLFESSGINLDSFEFISPEKKPISLRAYEFYLTLNKHPKKETWIKEHIKQFKKSLGQFSTFLQRKVVGTRSLFLIGIIFLMTVPIFACRIGWGLLKKPLRRIVVLFKNGINWLMQYLNIHSVLGWVDQVTKSPKDDSMVTRWYRLMMESESSLMIDLINARRDISAWYSPTAFWPDFHKISGPRLMCVPDVVMSDFPIGYARAGSHRMLDSYREVEKSIAGGEHFVTYSEDVKWRTLVHRYHTDPANISVVPHGINSLSELVVVSGFTDNKAATDKLCRNIFKVSLLKAINHGYANLLTEEVRFIFYASQVRPNKNIISLLRAYDYLLKRRYIGHKLVLTCTPKFQNIDKFIKEHNLENDVLFLHGLTAQELAACYRIADLAVNPSFSEGGCPFTFSEALSVDTPVVMAQIPVTEEIIKDPELQELMFFDPYDWKDMADRIEWGLTHRELLLAHQKPFYEQLGKRTWHSVVDEYVEILDRISIPQKEVI